MSTSPARTRALRPAIIAALAAVPLLLTACGPDLPAPPGSPGEGEEVEQVEIGRAHV